MVENSLVKNLALKKPLLSTTWFVKMICIIVASEFEHCFNSFCRILREETKSVAHRHHHEFTAGNENVNVSAVTLMKASTWQHNFVSSSHFRGQWQATLYGKSEPR